jgi:hypothetical protein
MRLLLAMHTYPIAFLTPHMKSCASSSQLSHVDPPAVRPVWIHILQIWGVWLVNDGVAELLRCRGVAFTAWPSKDHLNKHAGAGFHVILGRGISRHIDIWLLVLLLVVL